MDAIKQMRKEVKKYIDTADPKVVKMMHAMLEVDADADWWDSMPDNIKADIEESIQQADNGKTIPHADVKKKICKMVYKVNWTPKAIDSYLVNIKYLEENWSEKEINKFIETVEKRIKILSGQPKIGSPRNKHNVNIRHTLIHKRVSLIYRIRPTKREVELLLFWNTYQNPKKLKAK